MGSRSAHLITAATRAHLSGLIDGCIWPKDGLASIAFDAMAWDRLSSPDGCAVIPRQATKSVPRHPPLTLRHPRVRRRSPSACRSLSRTQWCGLETDRIKENHNGYHRHL